MPDRSLEKYRFGPLRSRETRKPSVQCPAVHFYRCTHCGNLLMSLAEGPAAPTCCAEPMAELPQLDAPTQEPAVQLSYLIFGSQNENAIKAYWECDDPEEKPLWVWLRTFTGGQLKYLSPKKRSPLLFGLADEDAYAYCDKDPCVECTFRCKRGFELFYYFPKRGVLRLPLERMTARMQTPKGE